MRIVQHLWQTTLGKLFVILTGGFGSVLFCCVGLLVLVAAINPSLATRSGTAARTAVVQQVVGVQDMTSAAPLERANLPSNPPAAVAPAAPPATVPPLPTATPQPTAAPSATPTAAPPSPTPVPQVQITQAVNMRAGPGTAFVTKQTVPPGTLAELLSMRNEGGTAWYEVRVNGKTGWMSGVVVAVALEQASALPVNTERFVPPTPVPAPQPAAPAPQQASQNCDPSYPDVCISPKSQVGDLNCGDIPYQRFRVVGADPHGFDRDNDGIGCES